MRHFIFVTKEGTTFQPGDMDIINEVENLQVLGFESGINEKDAFEKLMKNSGLGNTSFNEVISYELISKDIVSFHFINKFANN